MELHEKIPNNVNLSSDPKLKRALENVAAQLCRLVDGDGPGGFPKR